MKKQKPQPLNAKNLAISATVITSMLSLLSTILAIIEPQFKTITPILTALYGPLGYNTTFIGAILGTIYISIDTFILTFIFALIYNKLL